MGTKGISGLLYFSDYRSGNQKGKRQGDFSKVIQEYISCEDRDMDNVKLIPLAIF